MLQERDKPQLRDSAIAFAKKQKEKNSSASLKRIYM